MRTQEELFNEWKMTCMKLEHMNVIVQNDLDICLAERSHTLTSLANSVIEFNTLYNKYIKELDKLKTEILQLVGSKLSEYNGHVCRYSKAMGQPYPRVCLDCGKPEEIKEI